MPMVASKEVIEQQNTGKGIVLLAVTACNWVKIKWSAKGLWSELQVILFDFLILCLGMFSKSSLVAYCQEGIIGASANVKAKVRSDTFVSRSAQQKNLYHFSCPKLAYPLTLLGWFLKVGSWLVTAPCCFIFWICSHTLHTVTYQYLWLTKL